MQVVCLTTLAVGARLAQKGHCSLGAIEELASMSMLCSDKTGTLTTGKMTMDLPKSAAAFAAAGQGETVAEGDTPDKEVVRSALLAAKWEDEPKDAIDRMLFGYDADLRSSLVSEWELLDFEPFSPSTKRTSAVVRKRSSGEVFRFVKGAPQIILSICDENAGMKSRIDDEINALAKAGVRALAVARRKSSDSGHLRMRRQRVASLSQNQVFFVGLDLQGPTSA